MKHPKIIGLAVVAILAMNAYVASAAQAAPLGHVESAPAFITGEQTEKHKFTTHAGTVECGTATFTGTVTEKTFSTLSLAPIYKSCVAFGFVSAEVKPNGCTYLFHLVEGSSPPTATVDVVCPAGASIQVIASTCTATVGSQSGLAHVVLSNTGAGTTRDIDANITVTGITYTLSGFCPNGTGTFHDGVYEGAATLKAFKDENGKEGAQQGGWVE